MERLIVEGGSRIEGRIAPSGNKNEALPCIAATLLTEEPVILHNIPRIHDVLAMLELVAALGAEVEFIGTNSVRVTAKDLKGTNLEADLARRLRASILFAGPMLARQGGIRMPPPGGDVIGRRRLDTHFIGLQALGGRLRVLPDAYDLRGDRLSGGDIFLDEPSVTATENVISAAVLARGESRISNVACEPHVVGLIRMLSQMGAKIRGGGTNELVIEGVERLSGTEYTIGPDYLEIGSLIGLAAVTGGELYIEQAHTATLRKIRMVFEKLGVETEILDGDLLWVPGRQELIVRPEMHGAVPRIDDAPWPQFPTDLMSIAIVTATQSRGTVLFFEKMYDGRMFFVDNLIAMGAQVILCDPHRVVVVGPSQLYGTRLESPDVRAGMAMLIAALCAKGTSTIYNIRQIDRGYERIEEKLNLLGARITREA
jgi:UDP-N-acetylglucosamine 1-carboxyvinyltransferase